jgi:hypothetical protein
VGVSLAQSSQEILPMLTASSAARCAKNESFSCQGLGQPTSLLELRVSQNVGGPIFGVLDD